MSEGSEHPYIPKLKEQFAEGKISRREFLEISTILGVSAGAAYAFVDRLGGEILVRPARAAMPRGGTIRIAVRVAPVTQPHTFSWFEPEISRQVIPHLTKIGPDNITRPHLLERWEASEDLRTWTLYLRKNVKWRKGGSLVADQVIWNIEQVLDPEVGSPTLGLMSSYMVNEVDTGEVNENGDPITRMELWDANAIEKIDDHTLRLNTKLPQIAVPVHLQHSPLGIQDPAEGGIFGAGSNGTGAFELVDIEPGRKAVMKSVSDYWEGVGSYIDTLEYIDLGDDPSAALGALAAKQVHGLYRGDIIQLDAIKQLPHVRIYEAVTSASSVARTKVTYPPFDDPRVRKAMRLAVDQRKVLEIAHRNLGLPAEHHHVCPIHEEYAKLPFFERNVEEAKRLLAEAGHPTGIDIEFTVKPDPAWELIAGQAMVEQWKEAGIRVKIDVKPSTLFWEVWDKVPFGFTEWAHEALGVINLSQAYRTGVPWNEASYSNPEFDALITEAGGILDVDKRRVVMAKIEKLMQEDGPIVQPIWLGLFTGFDKRVKGYSQYPNRFIHANELAIEA